MLTELLLQKRELQERTTISNIVERAVSQGFREQFQVEALLISVVIPDTVNDVIVRMYSGYKV